MAHKQCVTTINKPGRVAESEVEYLFPQAGQSPVLADPRVFSKEYVMNQLMNNLNDAG